MNRVNNLPHTTEEQIRHLAENPNVNRNWLRFLAYDAGMDWDDKYDQSFGRAEQAIAEENLEANEE